MDAARSDLLLPRGGCIPKLDAKGSHQHLRSTVGCWGSLRSYSGKVTGTLAVRQIRRPQ